LVFSRGIVASFLRSFDLFDLNPNFFPLGVLRGDFDGEHGQWSMLFDIAGVPAYAACA
jgi:hypothetical protein